MSAAGRVLIAACCLAAGMLGAEDPRVLQTPRHRFAIAPSALPAQIVVEPDLRELPLESRAPGAELDEATLAAIGRGKRLRAPLRLEAAVDGVVSAAEVTRAGPLVRHDDGSADCRSELIVGPYDVTLEAHYGVAGELTVKMAYERVRDAVGTLALVFDLAGPIDLLYRPETSAAAASLAKLDPTFVGNTGIVWRSDVAGQRPGPVEELFIGSGDGGFTWRSTGQDEDAPTMTLTQDELGRLTWRVLPVSFPAEFRGRHTLSFQLTTQPTGAKAMDYRRRQWLDWPGAEAAATVLSVGPNDFAAGRYGEMSGLAAADMRTADEDNISLYSPAAFRLAAGTWTALTVRIQSNVRILHPGDAPAFDRQILGRALLHDVGVAISGVEQPVEFLRLVRALREFGYFDDQDTEFIPYWRSDELVRYGEIFESSSAFALSEENPAAYTYVSVYRRPLVVGDRKGFKALFVIMNERSAPARERLYLLAPERLLGGAGSSLTGLQVIGAMDFGSIPDDSDWRRQKLSTYHPMFGATGLKDAEDGGYVKVSSSKGQAAAIYGPVYIPRHDYRLLYGQWLP